MRVFCPSESSSVVSRARERCAAPRSIPRLSLAARAQEGEGAAQLLGGRAQHNPVCVQRGRSEPAAEQEALTCLLHEGIRPRSYLQASAARCASGGGGPGAEVSMGLRSRGALRGGKVPVGCVGWSHRRPSRIPKPWWAERHLTQRVGWVTLCAVLPSWVQLPVWELCPRLAPFTHCSWEQTARRIPPLGWPVVLGGLYYFFVSLSNW